MKFVPEFTIIEDGDETGADDTMHAMAGHKAQTAIRSYQQGNAERQLRYAHRVFDRVAQILEPGRQELFIHGRDGSGRYERGHHEPGAARQMQGLHFVVAVGSGDLAGVN